MTRARALAAVLFGIAWLVPAIAQAQNLEAGKSPAQLFSNTCAVCHKSARGLVRSVPPGSLPSFLREHYTTSREMAQQLAGYLMASGGTDTRGRPQEARQAPAGAEPAQSSSQQQQQQQARQPQPEASQVQRPSRTAAEEQAQQQRPPESAAAQRAREAEERRAARREMRAKQAQEAAAAAAAEREKNRRSRVTPSRIDAAAARGKDALPLGDILKNEPPAAPEPAVTPPPETKPETRPEPSETMTRPDPVPQVTPAPAETPRESAAPEPSTAPEPTGELTGGTPEDGKPPAASGPPPVPPISN